MWAVLVFDGDRVEFAPELYDARGYATEAAERWAWILASNGAASIRRRGAFEWMAGFRHILVARVESLIRAPKDPWLGISWNEGCYPTSAIEVFSGLREAADWVGSAAGPTELSISEWDVASAPAGNASRRRAMACRAKIVATA